jgi:hypothetical protein
MCLRTQFRIYPRFAMLNFVRKKVKITILHSTCTSAIHREVRPRSTYDYSVCPPRRNWDSPNPSPASECEIPPPPWTKGWGAHSHAGEGLGESLLRRLEKKLSTLPTLWVRLMGRWGGGVLYLLRWGGGRAFICWGGGGVGGTQWDDSKKKRCPFQYYSLYGEHSRWALFILGMMLLWCLQVWNFSKKGLSEKGEGWALMLRL